MDIDFVKLLISVIHGRAFKNSTTYPFACIIFQLCSNVGVPIWHRDALHTPIRTVGIRLTRDEANVGILQTGPRV